MQVSSLPIQSLTIQSNKHHIISAVDVFPLTVKLHHRFYFLGNIHHPGSAEYLLSVLPGILLLPI